MTDQEKELVELAAKAMGKQVTWGEQSRHPYIDRTKYFNPLPSRDDRGLLMDELGIDLQHVKDRNIAVASIYIWGNMGHVKLISADEPHNGTTADRCRAACLAVTRVAAEIGRSK